MSDEELIAQLQNVTGGKMLYTNTPNHLRLSAAARIRALRAERDEALESVTNNNDWFGMHCTLWVWLITQPDMPQLDDLEDGGADEVARNYERAITALVDARTAALRERVARLECAGDFARLIGNDVSKDDKDTVLVSYGMLRRLRAALTDGGKHV